MNCISIVYIQLLEYSSKRIPNLFLIFDLDGRGLYRKGRERMEAFSLSHYIGNFFGLKDDVRDTEQSLLPGNGWQKRKKTLKPPLPYCQR